MKNNKIIYTTPSTLNILDVESKEIIKSINGYASCFCSSNDGSKIAIGNYEKIKIYDSRSCECLREIVTEGYGRCINYSNDDRFLVWAGANGKAILVDAETGECIAEFKGHVAELSCVCFSPNGLMIGSCSWDKTIRLWNVETRKCEFVLEGHSDTVFHISFSPDGSLVASASADETSRIWDVNTGKQIQVLEGHTDYVRRVCFLPDCDRVVTGGCDASLRMWDIKSGKHLKIVDGLSWTIRSIELSQDGGLLLSCYEDSIIVWDVESGEIINKFENVRHVYGTAFLKVRRSRWSVKPAVRNSNII